MHSLDVLEYETRRVDIWQINGANHARRIVARLQYVVNGKPSVSNVLSLGVPQLYGTARSRSLAVNERVASTAL